MPIRDLKKLMGDVGVDSTKCVEKAELVAALAASGRVTFAAAEEAPPAAAAAPRGAGTDADADEKASSPDDEPRRPFGGPYAADEFKPPPAADGLCYKEDKADAKPFERSPSGARVVFSRAELAALSVRRLKDALAEVGRESDVRGCCDKGELRRALANAPGVHII